MKKIVIALAKKYAVSTVQTAIKAKSEEVQKWTKTIGFWLAKLRLATAYLERLATRLEDGELSNDEVDQSMDELAVLSDQLAAKEEEGAENAD